MLNRPVWRNSLGLELIGAVVLSLMIAAAAYIGMDFVLSRTVMSYFYSDSFLQAEEDKNLVKLQAYVDEHQLRPTDWEQLDEWAQDNYTMLFIVQGNELVYYSNSIANTKTKVIDNLTLFDTTDIAEEERIAQGEGYDQVLTDGTSAYQLNEPKDRDLQFGDEVAQVSLQSYSAMRYAYILDSITVIAVFAVFLASLLLIIRVKTGYIVRLEKELKMLEAGDLNYKITVSGRDELAELANGINDMRVAMQKRQQEEESARTANHELVTAMSHDLRSPLTALIGYLNLAEKGKYKDEEQLKHFLRNGLERANHIKEMSDKLFEYFLVYSEEGKTEELQSVEAAELVNQMIGECIYDLESRGFHVEWQSSEVSGLVEINVPLFRRVLYNLSSNLVKYADKRQPVQISAEKKGAELQIVFQNSIDKSISRKESTNIGLKTCEKILTDHRGSFQASSDGETFRTELLIPFTLETF